MPFPYLLLTAALWCAYRLPHYESVEQAREKIRYAIHAAMTIDTDGYGGGEQFVLD